jgi:hypothetical protein
VTRHLSSTSQQRLSLPSRVLFCSRFDRRYRRACPGIAAWWTGRRITGRANDPVLPELLFARSQRLVNISTTAFVATAFVGGRHAYWGALLITASMIVGGYPLRRALGLETDGVVRHLWRSAKSIVGGLGFWLLLLITPEIVLALDPRYRLFSLLLIPILLAWEHWYPRLWLWLHDSQPLRGDELLSRIDGIVARAGIVAPASTVLAEQERGS